MLFTFLITIVFIAELIIAFSIIINLVKFDKFINGLNETVQSLKPLFQDIFVLVRKISLQFVELSRRFVCGIEVGRDEIIIKQIAKFILGILFFNRLRKSKIGKTFAKGLSLIEIVL